MGEVVEFKKYKKQCSTCRHKDADKVLGLFRCICRASAYYGELLADDTACDRYEKEKT